MLVINFDPEEYNLILAGEETYFLFRLSDSGWILVNDRCQHRGGPLHLGYRGDQPNCLVCPWHEMRYSEKALRKCAVPFVYRNGIATAVFDMLHTKVRLLKKTILANES